MAGEIPKKILALLIVVTLAVSIMGTWIALSISPEVINVEPEQIDKPVGTAQVSFSVGEPSSIGEGQIRITINNEEVDE